MPPKILFIHSSDETFVKLDHECLITSFEVHDFFVTYKFPANFLQYWAGIKEADILFCWFASWNSFWALLIAKLLHKKSVLVIGGYDLANLPEANYGHQRGGLEKMFSSFAMKLATVLFTNSYYSKKEAKLNAGILSERVQVIYHGIPDPFDSLPSLPKEKMVLTVGKVDQPNLKRKGIGPLVLAAAQLPEVSFVVVGTWADDSIDYLRSIASNNVVFTGRVSDDELINYYKRASVYVQASLHEGFGLSVAEAMLAGCIPVTTRAGSLPEVVGDCGFYSDSSEPSDIAKAIELALNSPVSTRERARERILNYFPMEKRKKLLEEIILSIYPQKSLANVGK